MYLLDKHRYALDRRTSKLVVAELMYLDCPFTWGLRSIPACGRRLPKSKDNGFEMFIDAQDYFPEYVIVRHLILAYEKTNIDLEDALNSISEAELTLADIKQKKTLKNVENVLEHILVATKCFILVKMEKSSEVEELWKHIYKIDETKMPKKELAMLNGCKCLVRLLYDESEGLTEIDLAKKAVENESVNSKWHYLLGMSYKKYRNECRSIHEKPSKDETLAFERAYRISKNFSFGITLAQSHQESHNYEGAGKIYKDIYDRQPTCCSIRLQLALGFIQINEFELAKHCLDYVSREVPNSPQHAHYMGIYEEKRNKDLRTALTYYQTAIDNSNYAAEQQYLECRKQIEPDWDPLPHLLEVLRKSEAQKDSDRALQEIKIQIGTYYLFEKRDISLACQYLTQAIQIQPNAGILKRHLLLFGQRVQVNIYHVLKNEVEFALLGGKAVINDYDTKAVLNDALELCHTYKKYLPRLVEFKSSKSLNQFRNHFQGFQPSKDRREEEGRMGWSSQTSVRNNFLKSSQSARDLSIEKDSPRCRKNNYQKELCLQPTTNNNNNNPQNLSIGNTTRSHNRNDGLKKTLSQPSTSGSNPPNLSKGKSGASQKKNYASKRSSSQSTQSRPNENWRRPNISENKENSPSVNRVPITQM